MYNSYRDNRSGGRSNGGNRGNGGGFNRNTERPPLHDATCSRCGNSCQVPFKPDGSRPVFCRDCFNKEEEGGGYERPSFDQRPTFAEKRYGDKRPAFGEKRAPFQKFEAARPAAPAIDTRKIEARLAAIEEKIDALIDALTMDMDDEDEDDEEGLDQTESAT